jgi:hypothetical protein
MSKASPQRALYYETYSRNIPYTFCFPLDTYACPSGELYSSKAWARILPGFTRRFQWRRQCHVLRLATRISSSILSSEPCKMSDCADARISLSLSLTLSLSLSLSHTHTHTHDHTHTLSLSLNASTTRIGSLIIWWTRAKELWIMWREYIKRVTQCNAANFGGVEGWYVRTSGMRKKLWPAWSLSGSLDVYLGCSAESECAWPQARSVVVKCDLKQEA